MKMQQVIKIIERAIPQKYSWIQEPYGAYNLGKYDGDVNRILFCVTPTPEVISYFWTNEYDLLISHHPMIISGVPMLIYHTCLDNCVSGLNDQWRDLLKIRDAKHLSRNLGWWGEVDPIHFEDLVNNIEKELGYKIKGFKYSDGKVIKSAAVCSGLGGVVFDEAEATKVDCYVTGELVSRRIGSLSAVAEVGHTISESPFGIRFFQNLPLPGIMIDCAPLDIDVFCDEIAPAYPDGDYIISNF